MKLKLLGFVPGGNIGDKSERTEERIPTTDALTQNELVNPNGNIDKFS